MGQAANAHRARAVAVQKIGPQRRTRGGRPEGDADVAVEHAHASIIARDHDGPALIPLAAFAQPAFGHQYTLHAGVEPPRAPIALAHGAQQPEALKLGEHPQHPGGKDLGLLGDLLGIGPLFERVQVVAVTARRARPALHGQAQHGRRGRRALPQQGLPRRGLKQQRHGCFGVPCVHRPGQLPDGPAKAPAVPQHHGLLGQRRASGDKLRRQHLPGHGRNVAGGLGLITAKISVAAQVTEHRARLHRRELVFVAQKHHPGQRWQGLQQGGHHLQVDHRGLVHDQHVHRQGVGRVGLELACIGPCTQQRMQGARRANVRGQGQQRQRIAQLGLQRLQGRLDGLFEPRRRFAGGRGQPDAQLLGRGVHRQQQGQQARGGIGFAGARAASDHAELAAQGHGTSHTLPVERIHARVVGCPQAGVGGVTRVWRRKQPVQPKPGLRFINRVKVRAALQHLGRHALLVAPVAAQVELAACQHQGFVLIGGIGPRLTACTPHQRAGLQRRQPRLHPRWQPRQGRV